SSTEAGTGSSACVEGSTHTTRQRSRSRSPRPAAIASEPSLQATRSTLRRAPPGSVSACARRLLGALDDEPALPSRTLQTTRDTPGCWHVPITEHEAGVVDSRFNPVLRG